MMGIRNGFECVCECAVYAYLGVNKIPFGMPQNTLKYGSVYYNIGAFITMSNKLFLLLEVMIIM